MLFFQKDFTGSQPIMLVRKNFMLTHAILPLLVLSIIFMGLEASGLDLKLSAHFYEPSIQQWPYKDHWLIQKVLHKGGRLVFFGIIALILGCLLHSFKRASEVYPYRRSLIYLLLASITGPIMIMYLKNNTHIYCPWDLQFFGSFRPYIRWFDEVPNTLPVGHCFPAAHAGSGYAFVSLYFFFLSVRPDLKFRGLGFGLGLGLVYGFTQQMRGAHFLSHDVAALAICWFIALALFLMVFKKQLRWQ